MTDLDRLREREAKMRGDARLVRESALPGAQMRADGFEERADTLLASLALCAGSMELTDALCRVLRSQG